MRSIDVDNPNASILDSNIITSKSYSHTNSKIYAGIVTHQVFRPIEKL